jgi:hypothetical protein
LWMDEAAAFTHESVSSHNSHWWVQDNPCVTCERRNQVHWGINVYAGIIGNSVTGPYLLLHSLSGPVYCVLLQEVVPLLPEDVPLAVHHMWFQHIGSLAHFGA